MAKNDDTELVREAVGIFFDAKHLKEAVSDLLQSGFARTELGLLAGEDAVQRALGDLYSRTEESANSPDAPCTAFVAEESIDDTSHAGLGSLMLLGGTTAAGAAVATAGVLGGGLLIAATATTAVAAIGALLAGIIHESDADFLEEQIDEGHLLLFVRTKDDKNEAKAVEILSKHCGFDARVYSVPACR
jgi:hypothetical protein